MLVKRSKKEDQKKPEVESNNFLKQVKIKLGAELENKRFKFDKQYIDVSDVSICTEFSGSVSTVSLGRHRDNSKHIKIEVSGVSEHENDVQGD